MEVISKWFHKIFQNKVQSTYNFVFYFVFSTSSIKKFIYQYGYACIFLFFSFIYFLLIIKKQSNRKWERKGKSVENKRQWIAKLRWRNMGFLYFTSLFMNLTMVAISPKDCPYPRQPSTDFDFEIFSIMFWKLKTSEVSTDLIRIVRSDLCLENWRKRKIWHSTFHDIDKSFG